MEGYYRYTGFELGKTSITDKYNKYRMYSVGGLVQEGEGLGHWSTSKEDIKRDFDKMFNKIAIQNLGKQIKWRRFPEWIEREVYENGFKGEEPRKITLYQITARFVWE